MKKLISVMMLCALLIGVSACSSGSDEPKEEKKEFYEMNEIIKTEIGDYTIQSVTKSQGEQYFGPAEGKEYVIVEIQIENSSDEEVSYNEMDFSVQNSNGQIENIIFTTHNQDTELGSGKIAPSGSVKGTIVFEQAIDDTLILLAKENMFDSEYVFKVNLK